MDLTTETVAGFRGGQAEVQNPEEGYLFRGEIESITVEEDELRIRFAWLGKSEEPGKWIRDDNLDFVASLAIYDASNIGPSAGGGGNRLQLNSLISRETAVLYPPDGSKLDRSRVKGL